MPEQTVTIETETGEVIGKTHKETIRYRAMIRQIIADCHQYLEELEDAVIMKNSTLFDLPPILATDNLLGMAKIRKAILKLRDDMVEEE